MRGLAECPMPDRCCYQYINGNFMTDYLYYRFYRLWLHSSVSEGAAFLAMLLFSVMLSTNVLTIWGILTQYGIINYPSDTQYYIIEGSLIALLCGRFFFKKRYRRIITKYEDENSVQRKVGAWALTVYIVATFTCFFIEALHRQGKYNLPLTKQITASRSLLNHYKPLKNKRQ